MQLKHYSLVLVALVAIMLGSCGDKSPVTQPEAIPVQIDGETSWSLMTPDGDIIAKNKLEGTPSVVYNGRFVMAPENNDEYYVYDVDDPTRPLNKEPFSSITPFVNGYAYATRPGTGILVVNRKGAVIKVLDDKIVRVVSSVYSEYVTFCNEDGECGLLEPDGEIKIKAKYNGMSVAAEGLIFTSKDDDDRVTVINLDGEKVFSLKEGETRYTNTYMYGWLGVNNEDGRGRFIDKKGETVMKMGADTKALMRWGDVVMCLKDGDYFLREAKEDGEKVSGRYDRMQPDLTHPGYFIVKKDDECFIIDSKGEKVTKEEYKKADFWGDLVFDWSGKTATLVSAKDGKTIGKDEFSDLRLPDDAYSVTSDKVYDKDVTAKIRRYITKAGWVYDGRTLNGSSTVQNVMDAMGKSARGVYYDTDYRSTNPCISGYDSDISSYVTIKFNGQPVRQTTRTEYEPYYGYPYTVTDCEPSTTVRIKAITTEIKTYDDRRTMRGLERELLADGFERLQGQSHGFRAGDTFVYLVPAQYGFYVVMSFSPLDYNRLMGQAMNKPGKDSEYTDYGYVAADSAVCESVEAPAPAYDYDDYYAPADTVAAEYDYYEYPMAE